MQRPHLSFRDLLSNYLFSFLLPKHKALGMEKHVVDLMKRVTATPEGSSDLKILRAYNLGFDSEDIICMIESRKKYLVRTSRSMSSSESPFHLLLLLLIAFLTRRS